MDVYHGHISWMYIVVVSNWCIAWMYIMDVSNGCISWVYHMDPLMDAAHGVISRMQPHGCTSWV